MLGYSLFLSKIVMFRSTSLKQGSVNRKLYVDSKNFLNLENPNTNEYVDPYSPLSLRHLVYIFTVVSD